jgi:hypothetical protein
MKNIIKYNPLILIFIVLFISCEDPDEIRLPEFLEGVNLRIQVDPDFNTLTADDLENAKIVFSVFSENKNLQEVEISVEYFNFQQDSNYSRRPIRVYNQADLDAANGAIRDVTITSQELAELFGVTVNDMGGGDRFDFYNVTSLSNGMVFPDMVNLPGGDINNVAPSIINGPTSSFTMGWTNYVACPIDDPTIYTGEYFIEQTSGPDDPFFGNPYRIESGVVNLVATSPIERSFELTYFTFTGIEFRFLLICGDVIINQNSGVSCSVGLIWGNQSPATAYDPVDDSELVILALENIAGDCGLPVAEPTVLTLTRID